MEAFAFKDYKDLLRHRCKERSTQRALADAARIQYTYVSKVLNTAHVHFNEDTLFAMCRHLGLGSEETDFALLLRARDAAASKELRADLERKIIDARERHKVAAKLRSGALEEIKKEMSYLLDPYCILVHVALYVERYKKDLAALAADFGLSTERLRAVLSKLAEAKFIELDARGNVTRLLEERLHYDTTHPLMRAHQALLKQASMARLQQLDDERKVSFMAAFTGDETTLEQVRLEFNRFTARVQSLSEGAASRRPYVLQFDFFAWA